MINWTNADVGDQQLLAAISILFTRNQPLIYSVLKSSSPSLVAPSEVIKKRSLCYSPSEQLLIKIALDVWNGSGGVHFNELYQVLDFYNFKNAIYVLGFLYSPDRPLFDLPSIPTENHPDFWR